MTQRLLPLRSEILQFRESHRILIFVEPGLAKLLGCLNGPDCDLSHYGAAIPEAGCESFGFPATDLWPDPLKGPLPALNGLPYLTVCPPKCPKTFSRFPFGGRTVDRKGSAVNAGSGSTRRSAQASVAANPKGSHTASRA